MESRLAPSSPPPPRRPEPLPPCCVCLKPESGSFGEPDGKHYCYDHWILLPSTQGMMMERMKEAAGDIEEDEADEQ